MEQSLRILLVEDNADDAALVMRELRRANLTVDHTRVECEEDYVRELGKPYDLILSDYRLPQFSGIRALELLQERRSSIPFILISGTMGEEAAVEVMKQGAADYLLKDRLARLGPAVLQALRQSQLRQERASAEAALRESEKRFRALIEHASDLIVVLNNEGQMKFQSPSTTRTIGCQTGEVDGRSAFELIHEEDRQEAIETFKRALTIPLATVSMKLRVRHHEGGWRLLEVIGRSVPTEAPDGFVIINARDITESSRLEEQFRQSQKMDAIGQLSGGIAHDFNNLLSVIHGNASLLRSHQLPKEAEESLQEIELASERAANLTRQLLAFSRRQSMQPRNLDLNEVVSGTVKMLQRILGEDICLKMSYSSVPLWVHVDRGMLDQILLNLAVNARDAMPRGGTLTIETTRSMLRASTPTEREGRSGAFACLSVRDTGCGIRKEDLPRIFEPFFTTKDVGKGTGLGLATVYGIVEQHQGWIEVQSQEGKGTTFSVFFPQVEAQRDGVSARRPMVTVAGGSETLLLVEDDPSVRMLIRKVLSRLGYRILEASTGNSALGVWSDNREEIRLLVTDVIMPDGMTGFELARKLLCDAPKLPIIFSSGYNAQASEEDIPLTEGHNFLQKPYHPQKLAALVRARLDD